LFYYIRYCRYLRQCINAQKLGIEGFNEFLLSLRTSKIAKIFGRNESVEQLKNAATKEEILEIFGKVTE